VTSLDEEDSNRLGGATHEIIVGGNLDTEERQEMTDEENLKVSLGAKNSFTFTNFSFHKSISNENDKKRSQKFFLSSFLCRIARSFGFAVSVSDSKTSSRWKTDAKISPSMQRSDKSTTHKSK